MSSTEAGAGQRASTRVRNRRGLVWIIIGVVILLYPVVATLYNDHRLDGVAASYDQGVREIKPTERTLHYIEQAREYNRGLAATGHHARPAVEDDPGFGDYMKTLNAPETRGAIARIAIPSAHIDLPVYHTTNPSVLYRGAGHMYGSDLPVGGVGTNSVISAHTGMVNASMFDNLPRLKDGDDIYISVFGERLRYQVTGKQVVKPDEYDAVTYEPGKDKLTLITCTPYGINTDRLLVEAIRVPMDDANLDTPWRPVLSWWMMLVLGVVLLALALVAYGAYRRHRRQAEITRR